MLHGSPTRPAHRAVSGGRVPARQTVEQPANPATGQHRPPRQRRPPRVPVPFRRASPPHLPHRGCAPVPLPVPPEPQRTPQRLMSGLAAVIVLSICGLIGFFIVADERRVHAESQSPNEPAPWAISSRAVDPEPLRIDEIFPGTEISLISGEDPYRVTMTHVDSECEIATTGGLGRVLAEQDCTQVIRAGMTAPYGGYLVTAGVFNLADETGPAAAGQQVRVLVESNGGTFATMAAGATPGSPPQTDSDAQIGWRGFGHYLVYCVIARPDGRAVAADDPYARRITADLLETYLAREKLAGRAVT